MIVFGILVAVVVCGGFGLLVCILAFIKGLRGK